MMVSTITNKMNTQAIRDELSEFVYSNFDADDMEILKELSDVFIQSHSCTEDGAFHRSVNLNLGTVIELMQSKRQRADNYHAILERVHPVLIQSKTEPRRGGVKCDLVFATFEGFLQACLSLHTKRNQQVSHFAAKCMSMVVRLHVALQRDLKKTKAELAEEKAQIQRRAFLVIKEAVREARRELGLRYTDCTWRLKNFTKCVQRMKGLIYYQGSTPFIEKNYLRNAHDSMKYYYTLCQRNPVGEQPHYTQTKLSDNFV